MLNMLDLDYIWEKKEERKRSIWSTANATNEAGADIKMPA